MTMTSLRLCHVRHGVLRIWNSNSLTNCHLSAACWILFRWLYDLSNDQCIRSHCSDLDTYWRRQLSWSYQRIGVGLLLLACIRTDTCKFYLLLWIKFEGTRWRHMFDIVHCKNKRFFGGFPKGLMVVRRREPFIGFTRNQNERVLWINSHKRVSG